MTPHPRAQILVVGAGFAGAVHARLLAEAGYRVDVVDRRNHIAGNAFDRVDSNGIRYHVYGPHLFHSKMTKVIDWLSRFAKFSPYQHRVRARLSIGADVPLPINRSTINSVFSKSFESASEAESFVRSLALPIGRPQNAAEYLYSRIGRELTDLFFRSYTKKMWCLDLEELSSAVVQRIPIRFDDTDTYFSSDDRQLMPIGGYTAVFEAMLTHENIRVTLNQSFDRGMESKYDYCFNSMAIDEYFDFCFGPLPYRSIRFHHATAGLRAEQDWAVTNFTDDRPFTRETAWHLLPNHVVSDHGVRTYTVEEPCDYKENNFERYYPVKTADGRYHALYQKYRDLAEKLPRAAFIGRCGTYQYLDMDQVINQSLTQAQAWLERRG